MSLESRAIAIANVFPCLGVRGIIPVMFPREQWEKLFDEFGPIEELADFNELAFIPPVKAV